MLDTAFEALKTFDWGSDLAALGAIEDAAIAANGKAEASQELENRLIAALSGHLTRDAQDFICRKLAMIGTAASVPALAGLLPNKGNSHMARFALEQIPGPEAASALRDALSRTNGTIKVGIIGSLGARRDADSVNMLKSLLGDADQAISRAATIALGAIGNASAASVLQAAMSAPNNISGVVVDALLHCAESLLANHLHADANSIYKTLANDKHPRLVRLAATRGLLACASKQA